MEIAMYSPNLHRLCRRAASVKTMMLVIGTVAALVSIASVSTHRTACSQCAAAEMRVLTDS
jgi:hypothetical protein